jgi:preprotein translocase subunit SecE
MGKIIKFFKESKEELLKVTWPTKKDTLNYTLVVISSSLAVAVFLGVLDLAFSKALEQFIF